VPHEVGATRRTIWAQLGARSHTAVLPPLAGAASPVVSASGRSRVRFCLPVEFTVLNLLPEVREAALERFSELAIPWHDGIVGAASSNHLLDSQVQ
jgi:hypothetical protein